MVICNELPGRTGTWSRWPFELFVKHCPDYFVNTIDEVEQNAVEVPALLNNG